MTAYIHRLASAAGSFDTPAFNHLASAFGRRVGSGLKSVQYARMLSVMNQLPDTYLHEAGLQRRDLPQFCRRAVYGER